MKNLNIKFIDPINFTLVPLKLFPKTFEIEGKKGDFPHYFNKALNQNYIGNYPDKKENGYSRKKKTDKKSI